MFVGGLCVFRRHVVVMPSELLALDGAEYFAT